MSPSTSAWARRPLDGGRESFYPPSTVVRFSFLEASRTVSSCGRRLPSSSTSAMTSIIPRMNAACCGATLRWRSGGDAPLLKSPRGTRIIPCFRAAVWSGCRAIAEMSVSERAAGSPGNFRIVKQNHTQAEQASILVEVSNEFLKREIQRLESEREAMRRELQQIQQSYAWRMVNSYRRWIARYRDNSVVRFYEKIALWMLNRMVENDEQDERKQYQLWLQSHKLTPEIIETMKAAAASFPYRPLISVVLSVGSATIENWLAVAIDSVRAQLYDHWQLCIASDESAGQSIELMLARYMAEDPRIVARHSPGRTAGAPIDLRDFVKGEFITFLDQFGQLGAAAFYQVVKRLNRNPLDDLLYWDEDKLDSEGRRVEPFFKPDWSPDLLLS